MTKSELYKVYSELEISQQHMASDYQAVRSFYLECALYVKKWFPIDDQLLKTAAVLDLNSNDAITIDQHIFLYNR